MTGIEIAVLASTSALAVVSGATFFVLRDFADKDTYYGLVREGSVRAVMKGFSLDHFIMSYEEHYQNDPREKWYIPEIPKWEVLPNNRWNKEIEAHGHTGKVFDNRSWILKVLGIYWIGLPKFRTILQYKFSWSEMHAVSNGDAKGSSEIWTRSDETTDFIFVSNFPYATKVSEAETSEGLQIDAELEVIIAVTNPYKALFRQNWLEGVMSTVHAEARNYIGKNEYKALLSETKDKWPGKPEDNPRVLSCAVTKNNYRQDKDTDSTPVHEQGLMGAFGAEVISVNLLSIAFSGTAKDKNQESSTKAYTAARDAEVIGIAAKAEGERITTIANAKAAETKTLAEAQTEAIRKKGQAEVDILAKRVTEVSKDHVAGLGVVFADAYVKSKVGSRSLGGNDGNSGI